MSVIEKEIEKYLIEVKSNLVCGGRLRRNIIKEIRSSVFDYADIKGIKDITEIYNHYGTPEDMARTYLSQVDPNKIRNAVNIRKVIIIGVVLALLIFAIYMTLMLIDGHKAVKGVIEEEVIEDTIVNTAYIYANYII